MRLNGWQRIGVVASLLWILGSAEALNVSTNNSNLTGATTVYGLA